MRGEAERSAGNPASESLSAGSDWHAAAIEPLAACLEDETRSMREAAFIAALELVSRAVSPRADAAR